MHQMQRRRVQRGARSDRMYTVPDRGVCREPVVDWMCHVPDRKLCEFDRGVQVYSLPCRGSVVGAVVSHELQGV
jgi:hypothetical protein